VLLGVAAAVPELVCEAVVVIVADTVLVRDVDTVDDGVIVLVAEVVAVKEIDIVGDDDATLPAPTTKEQLP
jgi:hypothetical protein